MNQSPLPAITTEATAWAGGRRNGCLTSWFDGTAAAKQCPHRHCGSRSGRHRHGNAYFGLWPLSLLVGMFAMLLAPSLTKSQLSYVVTWPYQLLGLIGITATLYTWLLCKSWLRQAD